MGNARSSSSGRQGHRSHLSSPMQPPLHPDVTANRYVYTTATPYPSQNSLKPNPSPYYHYPGYYHPQAVHTPFAHPYRASGVYRGPPSNLISPHYPCDVVLPQVTPYVEHQKAVTIRNDVNVKKETLRMEQDEEINPRSFLVSFTFDDIALGSITSMFVTKEDQDCNLIVTRRACLNRSPCLFSKVLVRQLPVK